MRWYALPTRLYQLIEIDEGSQPAGWQFDTFNAQDRAAYWQEEEETLIKKHTLYL